MKSQHENISAYVLHTRPFRETSLLVEFFTATLGRCSAVARGAYRAKGGTRALLQAFMPLHVSLKGQGELLTLSAVELASVPRYYQGSRVVCGLYLNELLTYTLHRYDPHPVLFQAYQKALTAFHHLPVTWVLRTFELTLLEALGYGIPFHALHHSSDYYCYEPERGFKPTTALHNAPCFSYAVLCDIAKQAWDNSEALHAAKYLTRTALAPLLAGKVLHSRELLQ